jgi:hypothetical protein
MDRSQVKSPLPISMPYSRPGQARRSHWTMRAISNRIRRLEKTFVPPVLEEGESMADILRARERRHKEASGEPYVEEPRIPWTEAQCRNVSMVDVLSGRYNDKNPRP